MWVAHPSVLPRPVRELEHVSEIPDGRAAGIYSQGRGHRDACERHNSPDVPLSDIDLGSWKFWVLNDDLRDAAFTTLRREAPISFHPPLETPGVEPGPGHWAVTRFEDVHYAR